jgi:hypothetical protein
VILGGGECEIVIFRVPLGVGLKKQVFFFFSCSERGCSFRLLEKEMGHVTGWLAGFAERVVDGVCVCLGGVYILSQNIAVDWVVGELGSASIV